ncbi:ATP-dependent RNA helicase [Suillus clintonianus]|uniref:ATP-dependent RNA helicase n=1 Tax=Suillus clintonianus TaxID=1904413 RepID=UPI001B87F5BF|nr:ATP-dependent RNA helicase [Suillus clintonianus]KAG2143014.1 ATP-dependent RNA helicase [Suillus clintonianus]
MSEEPKSKLALVKRKAKAGPSASRKRLKIQPTSLDGLPWKAVHRPSETGLDGDDGILELEEVENVEVVYEDTEGGRVMKFNVLEPSSKTTKAIKGSEHGAEVPSLASSELLNPSVQFDSKSLLPNWHAFCIHSHLLQVLHSRGFATPTPIQAKSLPIALNGRDVVGVAETGSGKTLAYGLPILHSILSHPRLPRTKRKLQALILAPTRELALQVSDHLNVFARVIGMKDEQEVDLRNTEAEEKQHEQKISPPLVSIAAIVGGMSAQKQRRILDRGVDVLVATPGRLWDILGEDEGLARQIAQLKFLVLDEADRMVEAGHFAEMDNILRLTVRKSQEDEIEPPEAPNDYLDTHKGAEDAEAPPVDALQTFVFSATLSKDLQKNLKRSYRQKSYKKLFKPASTLDDLLLRLDFRDPDPAVIDISPEGGVVSTLKESKIECLSTDKDAYLYYFLLRYPGRSLVFLSSIDGIRRLSPLMELLNLKAFPLHSQMEQRQRLKNLDRFKTTTNAVLLATDIAARGLDIPAVDHVVHYQIPRSADVFVHRNGRTARAMQKGFSLLMCAPDERRVVRALLASLGRNDADIPEVSVELTLLDKLKNRILLARQIDSQQHKIKKQNHERNWLKETAEAMEIELDSDILSDADESHPSKQRKKKSDAKIAALKAKLNQLMSQPLLSRGVSTRYITSGSRPIADDIISGDVHEIMLGLKKSEAGDDLVAGAKKKPMNKKEHEEPEEWNGFGS